MGDSNAHDAHLGVTKQHYIADTKRALSLTLTADEMHALESLADQAHIDTRANWEQNMKKIPLKVK